MTTAELAAPQVLAEAGVPDAAEAVTSAELVYECVCVCERERGRERSGGGGGRKNCIITTR